MCGFWRGSVRVRSGSVGCFAADGDSGVCLGPVWGGFVFSATWLWVLGPGMEFGGVVVLMGVCGLHVGEAVDWVCVVGSDEEEGCSEVRLLNQVGTDFGF